LCKFVSDFFLLADFFLLPINFPSHQNRIFLKQALWKCRHCGKHGKVLSGQQIDSAAQTIGRRIPIGDKTTTFPHFPQWLGKAYSFPRFPQSRRRTLKMILKNKKQGFSFNS